MTAELRQLVQKLSLLAAEIQRQHDDARAPWVSVEDIDALHEAVAALSAPPGSLGDGKSGDGVGQLSQPDVEAADELVSTIREFTGVRLMPSSAIELLERLAKADKLRLHLGEMTAQEMRTAKAAVRYTLSQLTMDDIVRPLGKPSDYAATPPSPQRAMAEARTACHAEEPGLLSRVVVALNYWMPDETMVGEGEDAAWDRDIKLLQEIETKMTATQREEDHSIPLHDDGLAQREKMYAAGWPRPTTRPPHNDGQEDGTNARKE